MTSSKEAVKNQNLNSPTQKKNIPTQSKKNYQIIWKIIFLFITAFSAFLLNKVYLYQTLPVFQTIRKGNIFELFLYGPFIGFIFIYIETIAHQKFDQNYQRYTTPEQRTKRSYTLVKWGYSIIYYTISSLIGYLILRQTSFMPTWLGGNGYCTDVTRYLINLDEANIYMKIFYIVQFGKHIGRFFHHVFIRSQGNFYQYALHHGLSTFLIFFSYLMNMWLIGIFVLLIHDISDCVLILGRAYRDYKSFSRITINIIYYIGGPAWVICRIFLLSYCCVYSSLGSAYDFYMSDKDQYTTTITYDTIFDIVFIPGLFMGFMLSALLVLQVFWTYFIVKAFIEIGVSSKIAKNTYEAA